MDMSICKCLDLRDMCNDDTSVATLTKLFFIAAFVKNLIEKSRERHNDKKKLIEKSKECHYHIPQPTLDTQFMHHNEDTKSN